MFDSVTYKDYMFMVHPEKVPSEGDYRWVSAVNETAPPINERLGDNSFEAKTIEVCYHGDISYEWIIYNVNEDEVYFRRYDTSMMDFLYGEDCYWRWAAPLPNPNWGYDCG